MNKTLCFAIFSTLLAIQSVAEPPMSAVSDISYLSVDPQVSFKTVTELPAREPNIEVAYGKDPLQYGQLWLPKQEAHKSLVILVHGGCWLNAFGVGHSFPMATALAQAGHPVWSLEYRRTGDVGGGWPGSYEDIKLALNQLPLIHGKGVNTDRPILIGHSAGGHLALLAATELTTIKFKQVIGLAAITDISRYALGQNSCQQATLEFMGGLPHERTAAYHDANLIYRKLTDKVVLLQGDADRIVPAIQAELYQVSKQLISGAGHFDWIHPGSPAFKKLLEVLDHDI